MARRTMTYLLAVPVVLLLWGAATRSDVHVVSSEVLNALAKKDWVTLAGFVHSDHGIRFSPYAYVSLENQVVLDHKEVAALGSQSEVRHWGSFDGSGHPIDMTFEVYFERFVYDRDFVEVDPGPLNERLGKSNTVHNIAEAYEGRTVVFLEYYVPGTEEFEGMDWRSLRLVFEDVEGYWLLIGIVHDQWTI